MSRSISVLGLAELMGLKTHFQGPWTWVLHMISVSGLGSHLSHECWVLDLGAHFKGPGSRVSRPTYEMDPGSRVSGPSESPGSRVPLLGYAITRLPFYKRSFWFKSVCCMCYYLHFCSHALRKVSNKNCLSSDNLLKFLK